MSDSEFFSKSSFTFTDTFTDIRKLYSSDNGYTEVYEARKALKRFALKALKREFKDDPFYAGMLRKEFEIGFRIEHPGVIQTYSCEEVEGLGSCIVLEWIEGETLEQNIAVNSLKEKEWQRVLLEICDALEYLDARQIVHRDIKPSNIMLTSNGRHAKLIDFGFADSPEYGSLKHSGGTRSYAAPEQMDPTLHPITHLSDIYAFGKLLQAIPIAKSKKLRNLIERMQAENPADRPQDIAGLKEELQNAFATRGNLKTVGLTGVFLMLCLLTAGAIWIGSQKDQSAPADTPEEVIPLSEVEPDASEVNDAEVKADDANTAGEQPEEPLATAQENNLPQEKDSAKEALIGTYSGGGYIYSEDYPIIMEMKIGADGKVEARYKNSGDFIWIRMRGRVDKYNIKLEHIPDAEEDFEMTMKFDYVVNDDRLELSGYADGADAREKVYVVLGKQL